MIELAHLGGREGDLAANLSGGFRQRLALGYSIISRPAILFLDEPTSGISPTSRRNFFKIIQRLASEGTTVSSLLQLYLLRYFSSPPPWGSAF